MRKRRVERSEDEESSIKRRDGRERDRERERWMRKRIGDLKDGMVEVRKEIKEGRGRDQEVVRVWMVETAQRLH